MVSRTRQRAETLHGDGVHACSREKTRARELVIESVNVALSNEDLYTQEENRLEEDRRQEE